MDIDVTTDENSVIIGEDGQTLNALEYIMQIIVNKEFNSNFKVSLRCQNYKRIKKTDLGI
jgi:spoIIIJ-associated protein